MHNSGDSKCRDDIVIVAHRDLVSDSLLYPNTPVKPYDTGQKWEQRLKAHGEAKLLIVKMEGYRQWSLPQGPRLEGLELLDDRRRMKVQEEMVCDLLEQRIGTRKAMCIRYTGIDKFLYFEPGAVVSDDISLTANRFPVKRLHFYIAELYCLEAEMRAGPRVQAFRFVTPAEFAKRQISMEERRGVEDVLENYGI